MGLIKAGIGAFNSTMADQWKEYFYCDSLDNDVLVVKGTKKTSSRSSNTKGSDNIITSGSGIIVNPGQCMIIVDQGQIVELCAEPGQFTYDASAEPSIFSGDLGTAVKETFHTMGRRFTFGGDPARDQRVYYFNTKEIRDNKFGTPNPFMYKSIDKIFGIVRTVSVRCNGIYTYKITDPIRFFTEVCGNITSTFTKDEIESQLKAEFIDALQPAFYELAELRLDATEIPAHANELKAAMNHALKQLWSDMRGITIQTISMNPITLSEKDLEKFNQLEEDASLGSNPMMMAGRTVAASSEALKNAASNPHGAMQGFLGMGMAMNASGGSTGFPAAQAFYQAGLANQQAYTHQQQTVSATNEDTWTCTCGAVSTGKFCPECGSKRPAPVLGWTCSCGSINKGKFCPECGAKKPASAPLYRCDKCGFEPEDPAHPPRFCPECGDPFNDLDIR